MESHLGDEEVWSAKLSIRPLDHPQSFAQVSRGNFPWGFYVMATRWRGGLVGQTWVTGENDHNFLSDRWIALKVLHEFPEVFFVGVDMES